MQSSVSSSRPQRARGLRIASFVAVGLTAAVVQLLLVKLLVDLDWNPLAANAVAFAGAAQVNFLLNANLTWRDRAKQPRRWRTYMSSIALTGVLNMAVFAVAHAAGLPPLLASLCGIAAAATINFVVADTVAFRHDREAAPPSMAVRALPGSSTE